MISRSVYGYRSKALDQTPLRLRIKEIAAARVRYGYQRIHVVLAVALSGEVLLSPGADRGALRL